MATASSSTAAHRTPATRIVGGRYGSANFEAVARRLWAESGYGPGDVDVVQIYENMTGMGVAP